MRCDGVLLVASCDLEEPCFARPMARQQYLSRDRNERRARVCACAPSLLSCTYRRPHLQNGTRTGQRIKSQPSRKRLVFAVPVRAGLVSWRMLVFSPRIASPRLVRSASVSFAHISTEGTIRPKDNHQWRAHDRFPNKTNTAYRSN
jgi:hypothetical protein